MYNSFGVIQRTSEDGSAARGSRSERRAAARPPAALRRLPDTQSTREQQVGPAPTAEGSPERSCSGTIPVEITAGPK